MHPAVVIIAAVAAKEFASAVGTELGKSLFGTRSSDLKEIRKQLAAILQELDRIGEKIDRIMVAVDKLPAIILGQLKQELVDEAYRYLEAYYENLRALGPSATMPELATVDRATITKAWYTVVELESRPALLMNLPFWTEFVRFYLSSEIDTTLRVKLETKRGKIRDLFDSTERTLSSHFERGEIALKTGHFVDTHVRAQAPFFEYKAAPAPMVERWRREHCTAAERYYVPDPAWPQKVAAQKTVLDSIANEIARELAVYNATLPILEMLNLYLSTLVTIGLHEPDAPAWVATVDDVQLVEIKRKSESCM